MQPLFTTDLSGCLHALGRAPQLGANVFLILNILLLNRKVLAIAGPSEKVVPTSKAFS